MSNRQHSAILANVNTHVLQTEYILVRYDVHTVHTRKHARKHTQTHTHKHTHTNVVETRARTHEETGNNNLSSYASGALHFGVLFCSIRLFSTSIIIGHLHALQCYGIVAIISNHTTTMPVGRGTASTTRGHYRSMPH